MFWSDTRKKGYLYPIVLITDQRFLIDIKFDLDLCYFLA